MEQALTYECSDAGGVGGWWLEHSCGAGILAFAARAAACCDRQSWETHVWNPPPRLSATSRGPCDAWDHRLNLF